MKITIRNADRDGEIIRVFNNPFTNELQDVVVKPKAHALKLIYIDDRVEEFYLENRRSEVVTDLDLDLEEIQLQYWIRKSMK